MCKEAVLAIDVGGGTQDILLFEPGKPVENCVQMVLPSQTVVVAQQVRQATAEGKPVYLYGNLMGGGASGSAVRAHLRAGLPVYANPLAAKTLHDDLTRVANLGVQVIEGNPPVEAVPVKMGDIDLGTLEAVLAPYGVRIPNCVAVAVQDHGESPGESNRLFRFRHWQGFVEQGGDIRRLLYGEIPPYFTRMLAVRRDVPTAFLADTGSAAIWGALEDPWVARHREQGLIIVNIGNQHTVGVLLQGWRIWGLFEHHTRLVSEEKLGEYVARLRSGTLTHREVYDDEGHGCFIHPGFRQSGEFNFVAVTGPQRAMAKPHGYYQAVPHGNMMLAGCYGLVAARMHLQNQ
ncbi:pyruvate formate lyase-activating protein [Clostridiales bacterium PH28_bin88]|nr:pyruvate formate lyase-activating protein [Clostridiales bacterium PH28_bin88]